MAWRSHSLHVRSMGGHMAAKRPRVATIVPWLIVKLMDGFSQLLVGLLSTHVATSTLR